MAEKRRELGTIFEKIFKAYKTAVYDSFALKHYKAQSSKLGHSCAWSGRKCTVTIKVWRDHRCYETFLFLRSLDMQVEIKLYSLRGPAWSMQSVANIPLAQKSFEFFTKGMV